MRYVILVQWDGLPWEIINAGDEINEAFRRLGDLRQDWHVPCMMVDTVDSRVIAPIPSLVLS